MAVAEEWLCIRVVSEQRFCCVKISIRIAIISIALYLTNKGEHTVLYKINYNV